MQKIALMMISGRNVSKKDKEDALLFKEFIYLLHATKNSEKKECDNEGDSIELNMGSSSCHSNEYKSDQSEYNPNFSDGLHNNACSKKYTNQGSEYGAYKAKNYLFDGEKKEMHIHNNCKTSNYFEGEKKLKNEPFQFTETDQGFICAYCESRYIYKRCLINHLLKSHRKLIKNCKFNTFLDL